MNGHPIRRCGSQGQQKSFLVSLKFAQYELMKESFGVPPMLLLDDVFDKLDMSRTANLLAMVAGNEFGQISLLTAIRSVLRALWTVLRLTGLISRQKAVISGGWKMGRYKGKSISMERKEPMQMDNIMPLFLKAMRLSAGMDVHLVLSAWDKVTGAAPYTLSKFLKDGVLIAGYHPLLCVTSCFQQGCYN